MQITDQTVETLAPHMDGDFVLAVRFDGGVTLSLVADAVPPESVSEDVFHVLNGQHVSPAASREWGATLMRLYRAWRDCGVRSMSVGDIVSVTYVDPHQGPITLLRQRCEPIGWLDVR